MSKMEDQQSINIICDQFANTFSKEVKFIKYACDETFLKRQESHVYLPEMYMR